MRFEDRLKDSAKRMMEEENSQLAVPKNPRTSSKKMNWGWIATPAAAIVGVLFGMSLPMTNNSDEGNMVAQLRDTIFLENDIMDTVFITKTVEKERIVNKVIYRDRVEESMNIAQTEDVDTFNIQLRCTSIACDDIDYAFFRR